MTGQDAAARALTEAAEGALNAGVATGRLGVRRAAAALAGALSRSPGLGPRAAALARDLTGAAAGREVATPARGDTRFTDPAWRDNPVYRRLGQAYLAAEQAVHGAVDAADVDWRTAAAAGLAARMLTSALAPTNTHPGNPAAQKRAFDTGGGSLLRGAQHALSDTRAGRRTPSQVDSRPFRLGENLAATPGAVVYRDEVVEVIQYAPTTPSVRTVPLLVVWSLINRYYILDLAPGRSFCEYAVSQGVTVFVTSWRNPGRDQARWDLDTYAAALSRVLTAVTEITGSPTVGTMGLCAGGQLLAAYLAHEEATGRRRAAYACFGVSQLDMSVPSVTGLAVSPPLPGLGRLASRAGGVLDGRDIAAGFSWLRPGELVWNYWVNNYLLGQDPPAFDILAWNADTTRLPGACARQLLAIAERDLLATPGGVTLLGTPVDLAAVTVPVYVIGAETDHLVPWRAAYQTTQLLGGDATFTLSSGGHVQHLVNPPGNPKSRYRTGPAPAGGPDDWLAAASPGEGSWWRHWAEWVHGHSGERRRARSRLGSRAHPPLDDAPGGYVRQR